MLKYLLTALMNSGIGERDSENKTSDFRNLTERLQGCEGNETRGARSSYRLLQDAFSQLKDMHKDNACS
jgi:hypothetical protein